MIRLRDLLLSLTFAALPATALATNLGEVTAEDYYGAAYFKQALEHPQVQKVGDRKKQVAVVAKDLKWQPKKLEAALEKVDGLSGEPIAMAKDALKGGFEGSRVKGRVLDVLINDQEPKHVVVYVRWQASTGKDIVKEAATIASVVAKEAPLVSTLSLAAIHPKAAADSKDAVWSGKIGAQQMGRIQAGRIDDYADRLYKNLFEGVESKPF